MAKIQDGSTVRFHYTLKVDGTVVDSSGENEPFEYVHGQKRIVPGLEQKLEGLEVGDKRIVTIPPEDGYGHPDPDLMHQVERAAFENSETLSVGDYVNGETPQGQFQARVAAIDDEHVTLDLNHPFAGHTLEFDVEIVEIQ